MLGGAGKDKGREEMGWDLGDAGVCTRASIPDPCSGDLRHGKQQKPALRRSRANKMPWKL